MFLHRAQMQDFPANNPVVSPVIKMDFDGDSLMYGEKANHDTESLPARLKAILGQVDYSGFNNYGVSGQTIDAMNADENSQILSTYDPLKAKNILVVGGGTNNMRMLESASSIYNKMKAYHVIAVAAGFKTVALTITSFNNTASAANGDANGVENIRLQLNILIRAGWKQDFGAQALVDFGSDPHIGQFDLQNFDRTYFDNDGVHLNAFGYNYEATLVAPAIQAIKAGLYYGDVTPLEGSLEKIVFKNLQNSVSNIAGNLNSTGIRPGGATATKKLALNGIVQFKLSDNLANNNAVVLCVDINDNSKYGWQADSNNDPLPDSEKATPKAGVFYYGSNFYRTTGAYPAPTPQIASAEAGNYVRIIRERSKVYIRKSSNKITWQNMAISEDIDENEQLSIKVFFAEPTNNSEVIGLEGYSLT